MPNDRLAALLEEARERTLALVEPLCEEQIDRQYSPIMSPLAWDLGHIAAFADLWLARAGGSEPSRPDLFEVYDATETPRSRRGDLPFLRCEDALAYGREILERALDLLETIDVSPEGDRLNARGLVWNMLIEHEHQHNETMIQAMQLAGEDIPSPGPASDDGSAGAAPPAGPSTVLVEGGPALLGAGVECFAYDNERPQHAVEVASFEIDRAPVTNGEFLAFVEAGGYRRREWWSERGWAWREREDVERPLFWTDDGRVRRFDRTEPLEPSLPVTHVSAHEAEAFARAHGRRLPTEAEWEKAATWDPSSGHKRRFPWGDEHPDLEHANLDLAGGGPEPAAARPDGASAHGVLGMTGDVWEWTAGEFLGYPGFEPFPYREYSEIFFGTGMRVLRGRILGHPPDDRPPDLPQLGLPRPPSAVRGLPLCQGRLRA